MGKDIEKWEKVEKIKKFGKPNKKKKTAHLELSLCELKHTPVFHYLSSVSQEQLCELAHLGCTCKMGSS